MATRMLHAKVDITLSDCTAEVSEHNSWIFSALTCGRQEYVAGFEIEVAGSIPISDRLRIPRCIFDPVMQKRKTICDADQNMPGEVLRSLSSALSVRLNLVGQASGIAVLEDEGAVRPAWVPEMRDHVVQVLAALNAVESIQLSRSSGSARATGANTLLDEEFAELLASDKIDLLTHATGLQRLDQLIAWYAAPR